MYQRTFIVIPGTLVFYVRFSSDAMWIPQSMTMNRVDDYEFRFLAVNLHVRMGITGLLCHLHLCNVKIKTRILLYI